MNICFTSAVEGSAAVMFMDLRGNVARLTDKNYPSIMRDLKSGEVRS
jgi:hypothetical protein